MATLKLILQAVREQTHAQLLRDLLNKSKKSQVLISVAFLREEGISAVAPALQPYASLTTVFVGIRNDITSLQAIKRLLAMKISVVAVDTGSRRVIFHPKVYLVADDAAAYLVIGSANMTFGGLHNNIELSAVMSLDLSVPADLASMEEVVDAFHDMLKDHPAHVFVISNEAQANKLFDEGRLADETIVRAPSPVSTGKTKPDTLPPMDLWYAKRPKPSAKTSGAKKQAKPAAGAPGVASVTVAKYLVWQSNALRERDLTIPQGHNTNPTGSMGLKMGALEGIDHRHYFRDEVFDGLHWIPDPAPSKKERADADFEIVIKNVSHGVFRLTISHNTDTTSKTYKQKNMMTHLHWGHARGLIAKRALLGRTLLIYRRDTFPPEFTLEID